jgi:hypothetical protein
MTEQQILAEGRRYVSTQQAKIEFQRERIRKLECLGHDAQMVRMEKQTLGAMMKSLDQVLGRLRRVIERVGHSE